MPGADGRIGVMGFICPLEQASPDAWTVEDSECSFYQPRRMSVSPETHRPFPAGTPCPTPPVTLEPLARSHWCNAVLPEEPCPHAKPAL